MKRIPHSPTKYVYGIIRHSAGHHFADIEAVGDPDATVHPIAVGDLAAVVSDATVSRYEVTRANMMAHERAIEAVMATRTVLPMRFSTIDTVSGITAMLTDRAAEFEDALRAMDGKVEVEIKASWVDTRLAFDEIVAENRAIRSRRDRLNRQGAASQAERIDLGKLVEAALAAKRRSDADRILAPLQRTAERYTESPVVGEAMILNAAFLLSGKRVLEFDRAVAALDESMGGRVNFKYFGPLPPFHFVATNREDRRGYVERAS